MGTAVLAAVAASQGRDAIDWAHVHVWWGDERFVPADDASRNDGAARAYCSTGCRSTPGHVHAMPASDRLMASTPRRPRLVTRARTFGRQAGDRANVPAFDIVLLGVGEDGHVASLFPDYRRSSTYGPWSASAAAKPPPTRISLTFGALNAAARVGSTAGAGKAAAVKKLALGGAGRLRSQH